MPRNESGSFVHCGGGAGEGTGAGAVTAFVDPFLVCPVADPEGLGGCASAAVSQIIVDTMIVRMPVFILEFQPHYYTRVTSDRFPLDIP